MYQLRTAGFETKGEDDANMRRHDHFVRCTLIEERKVMRAFSIGIFFMLLIDCLNKKEIILE